jgi:mannose-6-phosphate isomerase-like protein (cupin superfamily)
LHETRTTGEAIVHHVGRVDWSFADRPMPDSATSSGLARSVLIGPAQGAVHSEIAVGALAAQGWISRHLHSFEETLYVLEGELVLELDGHVHALAPGDFALIPIGVRHTLANVGGAAVRWFAANTPQRFDPASGRRDTYYEAAVPDLAALADRAQRPGFGQPDVRWVGHYDGTPPQAEALRVTDPARGRRPAGMDTAILAYSGISVKMLIDRVFGAELLTVFTVDYEPVGAAQIHDHPFEETYFFLDGEIQGVLDGEEVILRAGDVVFAGVGSTHGFFNTGNGRVRWIETQAPQPPARHAYRWVDAWKRYEKE